MPSTTPATASAPPDLRDRPTGRRPDDRPAGAAVTARGLTKRFGDVLAVDRLDLDVAHGSVVALLGPNGAGKTTTVQMIATLESPTDGSLRVCGHDVRSSADEVRRRISLTGQFAALEDNLSARHNLLLMARLRGHDRRAAARVVDGLVERFEIGEFADQLVKDVSGGQRRRVDLAAGLVTPPELLVLDEPTTGLDPRSRQIVWSTVRELVAEGVTLLLTTQYLEEADVLADEIVLIDHGRTVAAGTPSELKSRIGEQRVDIVAVDASGVARLVDVLGGGFDLTVSPELRSVSVAAPGGTDDLARVTAALGAADVPVDEVALRRPTLDDAFLALTGDAPSGATDGSTSQTTDRTEGAAA